MRTITRGAVVAAATTLALGMAGTAFAAPGGTTGAANLKCFTGVSDNSGYGGTCITTGKNRNGAVLSNDSNAAGSYAGVYLDKKDLNGKPLSKISALGYTHAGGNVAPTAGDLSLNFGVDTTGDGLSDGYAYVDAFYCAGTNGVVDVIHDGGCGIWFQDVEYSNWAMFVTAFPTASVGRDGQPFIVAEWAAGSAAESWTISNVVMGKVG